MQSIVDSVLLKMVLYQLKEGFTYSVSEDAPDTYERLRAESSAHHLIVWSGASVQSIWGTEGNYLFRAVHDYIHLTHGLSFDSVHEAVVCDVTCAALDLTPAESALMRADIIGQLEYKERHGAFPADQINFVKNYLSF